MKQPSGTRTMPSGVSSDQEERGKTKPQTRKTKTAIHCFIAQFYDPRSQNASHPCIPVRVHRHPDNHTVLYTRKFSIPGIEISTADVDKGVMATQKASIQSTLKTISVWAILVVALVCVPAAAWAGYKNKISVLPLEDPPGWTAGYAPGAVVTGMLKHSLTQSSRYHIYPPPKKKESRQTPPRPGSKTAKPVSQKMKNGGANANTMKHPVRFLVQGKVLHFDPGEPPTKAQKVFNAPESIKQRAEVEIEIELASHHTGNAIARKTFRTHSIAGVVPFEYDGSPLRVFDAGFQRTSLGKALSQLDQEINAYIAKTLHPLPLEAEIIAVDAGSREVIINAGKENGIGFGDFFTVYTVTLENRDPFSQKELGGRFTRRGVVRVRDVQENFSVAAIMAGEGFQAGELVRSKKTNPAFRETTLFPQARPGFPSP